MAYSEFSLTRLRLEFGLRPALRDLFPGVVSVQPPAWLPEHLARGRMLPMVGEKARSELIVMPILMAVRELVVGPLAIYSGLRIDIAPTVGLAGECDFVLARTEPLPDLSSPVVTVVEAKKQDVDAGLGQCAGQMLGVRRFNEAAGENVDPIHGCVTSGDAWQFLRLTGPDLLIDTQRYFIRDLPRILGVFATILA